MRVYVGTDIEGVAGVVSFTSQSYPDGKYYEHAKRLLTAEINAAVEGMLEKGVHDILVVDGHGPGGIVFEELHPEAKLLHGRPAAPRSVRDPIVEQYDVCIMLGQHSMAGNARGNLSHTQNSRSIESYTLNGVPIGEIAQFALYQGALGLPLIFLSGDDQACAEAEALISGITTTAVKTGLSRNSAISLSAQKAKTLIREGIMEAIKRHTSSPLAPLVWQPPFVLEKRYYHTDTADAAAAAPGAERIDELTVRLHSDSIRDIIYR